jgi:hypothetical protein
MKLSSNPCRFAGLAAFSLVLLSLGADSEVKSYEVGEVKFEAPSAWKSVKPRSAIIQLQFVIPRVKGDPEDAVLTVASSGGGTEANVLRWRSQFKDADGNIANADTKSVKAKNVSVTRVEILGHYFPPRFLAEKDREDFFLLAGVVETKATGYYFKLLGPEKTVASAREAFDRLIASISATETQ